MTAPCAPRGTGRGRLDPGVAAIPATGSGRHRGVARSFTVLIAIYPLAWALGLAPVVWVAVGIPMALWLRRRRQSLLAPRGFTMWLLYLGVAGLSIVQVNSAGRIAIWGLRSAWYVAATICVLYLVNQSKRDAVISITRALIGLWVITAVGGWAGLVAPDLAWTGLFARGLPAALRDNALVADLTEPALAELQRVGGTITLRRPAAPFAYTNNWGSTYALLTPFVLLAIADRRIGLPRTPLVVMLALGMVPFALALNRGSWLTLGVGLAYGGIVLVRSGNRRVVYLAGGVVAGALLLAAATGAVGQLSDQLEARSTDSNETRSALYDQTFAETKHSPLIGYGTPRPSPQDPDGPPLGTHGQLWMVMYSHGFLGAALFVGFFGYTYLLTNPATPTLLWSKVALLIGLLQMPIYGHLPHQLFVMMAAVALIHLAARPGEDAARGATAMATQA